MPEPGDIVEVWNNDEDFHFVRVYVKYKAGSRACCETLSEDYFNHWGHRRVLARKPRRWVDLNSDERADVRYAIEHFTNYVEVSKNYDKILSCILGGVPYARVD